MLYYIWFLRILVWFWLLIFGISFISIAESQPNTKNKFPLQGSPGWILCRYWSRWISIRLIFIYLVNRNAQIGKYASWCESKTYNRLEHRKNCIGKFIFTNFWMSSIYILFIFLFLGWCLHAYSLHHHTTGCQVNEHLFWRFAEIVKFNIVSFLCSGLSYVRWFRTSI